MGDGLGKHREDREGDDPQIDPVRRSAIRRLLDEQRDDEASSEAGGRTDAEDETSRKRVVSDQSPTVVDHDSLRIPVAQAMFPDRIGRFDVIEQVGRGGFGTVYRAIDRDLNREVAVKWARPDVASHPDTVKRFQNEAAVVASLEHPGIVSIYEAGEHLGLPYYVMPFCEGLNLLQWLQRRKEAVDPLWAARLIAYVAHAVDYGHRHGVVHRDLKPGNIMLAKDVTEARRQHGSAAMVVDFGLAGALNGSLNETRTSLVLGTPLYMSPEQARLIDREIGPETDVFSLGAILYRLLAGVSPLASNVYIEVIDRLRECQFDSVRSKRPEIDRRLDTICMKCLRLYPEDRYQSAGGLAADLVRFLNDQPVEASQATWLDRWRWVARKPQRLVESGIVSVFANLTVAGITWLSLIPTVSGAARGRFVGAFGMASLIALFHCCLAAVAVMVIRGHGAAYVIALTVSTLNWLAVVAVMMGAIEPWYTFGIDPATTWSMHLVLMLLFTFQVVMFANAWPAFRSKRKTAISTARATSEFPSRTVSRSAAETGTWIDEVPSEVDVEWPASRHETELEELTRRWFDEVFNRRNLDVIDQLMDKNVVLFAEGETRRGRDVIRNRIQTVLAAFDPIHFAIEELYVSGSTVMAYWCVRKRHVADFMGIPPTQRWVELRGSSKATFRDGKMIACRDHWDVQDLIRKLKGEPSAPI